MPTATCIISLALSTALAAARRVEQAAADGSVGIHVASPGRTDKQRIEQNTISGSRKTW